MSTDDNPNSKSVINSTSLKVISVMALVTAFAVMIIFGLIPKIKYDKACALYAEGKLDEAKTAFESVDYMDSKVLAKKIELSYAEKGEVITFGKYDWLVLEKTDEELLLITNEAIGLMNYDFEYANVTWENSRMRPWLNFDFYEENFSDTERSVIIERENPNPQNPEYSFWSGDSTSDRIYLLSIDEANLYFESKEDRICIYEDQACIWWLRTPGFESHYAAVVSVDGSVLTRGVDVGNNYTAVRPVTRVSIK